MVLYKNLLIVVSGTTIALKNFPRSLFNNTKLLRNKIVAVYTSGSFYTPFFYVGTWIVVWCRVDAVVFQFIGPSIKHLPQRKGIFFSPTKTLVRLSVSLFTTVYFFIRILPYVLNRNETVAESGEGNRAFLQIDYKSVWRKWYVRSQKILKISEEREFERP